MPKTKRHLVKTYKHKLKKYKPRRKRFTYKKKGGTNTSIKNTITNNSGSDIRNELVRLCKHNKWDEYDALTQHIMKEYWVNGEKDFFIHLDRNIKGFKNNTLRCLKLSLTQLQEDAIPESMKHLSYIMEHT